MPLVDCCVLPECHRYSPLSQMKVYSTRSKSPQLMQMLMPVVLGAGW